MGLDNMERIAAVAWAGRSAGLSYGQMVTRMDAGRLQEIYQRYAAALEAARETGVMVGFDGGAVVALPKRRMQAQGRRRR